MSSETYTPETPLVGDLEVEARAASIEPGFTVKGLFFDKLRSRLGDAWDEVKTRLDAAPRLPATDRGRRASELPGRIAATGVPAQRS
jgi:hypothetical protein